MNITAKQMNLTTLKAKISEAVAAAAPSIKTTLVGYLQELNTGREEYDCLVLIPPKTVKGSKESLVKDYQIRWFIATLDRDETGSRRCNEAERVSKWDELEATSWSILNKLTEDTTAIQLVGGKEIDLNSGGIVTSNNEDTIWIEATFILRTDDCTRE
jgi:hypothetical protein